MSNAAFNWPRPQNVQMKQALHSTLAKFHLDQKIRQQTCLFDGAVFFGKRVKCKGKKLSRKKAGFSGNFSVNAVNGFKQCQASPLPG